VITTLHTYFGGGGAGGAKVRSEFYTFYTNFWPFSCILHTLENMNKNGHGQDRRLVLLWTVTRRDDNFAH
jgi:hypothetical protein